MSKEVWLVFQKTSEGAEPELCSAHKTQAGALGAVAGWADAKEQGSALVRAVSMYHRRYVEGPFDLED